MKGRRGSRSPTGWGHRRSIWGGVVPERLLRVGVQGESSGEKKRGLKSPVGGHGLDFDSGPLRDKRKDSLSAYYFCLLDSTSLNEIPLLD